MSKMGATSAQVKAETPKKKLDYRPLAGAPDEMLGPDGEVRPVWRHFLDRLSPRPPAALAPRTDTADR